MMLLMVSYFDEKGPRIIIDMHLMITAQPPQLLPLNCCYIIATGIVSI